MSTTLTQREKDVVGKLSEGKPDKIIADELSVSIETVRYYLRGLFLKFDVDNRTALIVAYFNNKKL